MSTPADGSRPDRIGPYEIVGVIGSGGMGVVYRARDSRLSRDVALKVIRPGFETEGRWRERFANEARAAAALNHPNVLAVHDVGIGESPYIVSELIDGGSLRHELKRGAVRLSRLLDIAAQIADGLAAAHQAGMVHRDLKPENVMLTKDGRAKIVDFGLATALGAAAAGGETRTLTAPNVAVGTPPYMSPEQARGETLDFRSDQFSFGAMLYEMASGRLAFDRSSSIDTLSAVIHDEPPPLPALNPQTPPELQRIVERCLAKSPADRYAATADLLHDLRWLKGHPRSEVTTRPTEPGRRSRRALAVAAGLACCVAAFAAGWLGKTRFAAVPADAPPTWRPITFEEGNVHSARFAPDGQTILYSASWDGQPYRIYSTTLLSPESRPLDLPPAGLLAISRSGQLALSLSCTYQGQNAGCLGTLARAPLLGGAPRPLAERVYQADWGPDDSLAAILGDVPAGTLEYPLGTRRNTRAQLVRVSPDGRRLATTERREKGLALVVYESATSRVLSEGWEFTSGLTWSTDGSALFMSGVGPNAFDDAVLRFGLDGTVRPVVRSSARLRVLDAGAGGLLVDQSTDTLRSWLVDLTADTGRRDLTWLGNSVVDAMSNDARHVLLTVRGGPTLQGRNTARELYPIYLRPTDGGAATLLGGGYGVALSPDGRWALTQTREGIESTFIVHPLGVGSARSLDRDGLDLRGTVNASFVGNDRVLFQAKRGEESFRTYLQSIERGPPVLLEHEPGRIVSPIAPDAQHFLSQRSDGTLWLATIDAGSSVRVPVELAANQFVKQWTADGREVFVLTIDGNRLLLTRVDVRTGRSDAVGSITRDRFANQSFKASLGISRDGRTVAYTDNRTLSTVFLIQGVR